MIIIYHYIILHTYRGWKLRNPAPVDRWFSLSMIIPWLSMFIQCLSMFIPCLSMFIPWLSMFIPCLSMFIHDYPWLSLFIPCLSHVYSCLSHDYPCLSMFIHVYPMISIGFQHLSTILSRWISPVGFFDPTSGGLAASSKVSAPSAGWSAEFPCKAWQITNKSNKT